MFWCPGHNTSSVSWSFHAQQRWWLLILIICAYDLYSLPIHNITRFCLQSTVKCVLSMSHNSCVKLPLSPFLFKKEVTGIQFHPPKASVIFHCIALSLHSISPFPFGSFLISESTMGLSVHIQGSINILLLKSLILIVICLFLVLKI